jgi:hypothetical protein
MDLYAVVVQVPRPPKGLLMLASLAAGSSPRTRMNYAGCGEQPVSATFFYQEIPRSKFGP